MDYVEIEGALRRTVAIWVEDEPRIIHVGYTGPKGDPGNTGPAGADSTVPGPPGEDGLSAYELAVAAGFIGTEEQWLDSLVGPAGEDGADSTVPGPAGEDGEDGLSAYEVAVDNGFIGTESAWLDSLVGPEGPSGPQGPAGNPATNLVSSVAGRQGAVVLTKADVGLSNVDNTADISKPISTATQTALDLKATDSLVAHLAGAETITGLKTLAASATTSQALIAKVTGDTQPRFNVLGDGKLQWGTGAAAVDTSLYRSSIGRLATDSRFDILQNASAFSLVISNPNATGQGITITIGAAAYTGYTSKITGDAQARYLLTAGGVISWGDGTSAVDTNLFRSAADTLKTDDNFIVGTSLRVNGNVGFFNTAPAAKPTVTGSRGGNAALASLLTALAGLGLITDSSSA